MRALTVIIIVAIAGLGAWLVWQRFFKNGNGNGAPTFKNLFTPPNGNGKPPTTGDGKTLDPSRLQAALDRPTGGLGTFEGGPDTFRSEFAERLTEGGATESREACVAGSDSFLDSILCATAPEMNSGDNGL